MKSGVSVLSGQDHSQRYAPFVLLAVAQTLTQKVLRAGCACAGRYAIMRKIIVTITFSLISSFSFGFQCGPEKSEEEKFREAESVLLFQVIATELKTTEFDGQEIGYSQATYRMIESFKGSQEKEGKVVEVLGYGTGLVGLIPGIYYLAYVGESNEYAKYPWLTICDVEMSTFNIEGAEFEKKLKKLRSVK